MCWHRGGDSAEWNPGTRNALAESIIAAQDTPVPPVAAPQPVEAVGAPLATECRVSQRLKRQRGRQRRQDPCRFTLLTACRLLVARLLLLSAAHQTWFQALHPHCHQADCMGAAASARVRPRLASGRALQEGSRLRAQPLRCPWTSCRQQRWDHCLLAAWYALLEHHARTLDDSRTIVHMVCLTLPAPW